LDFLGFVTNGSRRWRVTLQQMERANDAKNHRSGGAKMMKKRLFFLQN